MLEDKVKEIFADMVVLKDPQRSEYFSNLSMPSYMRDWLVMKFSDDDGIVDYDSINRYIKRFIPGKDDFEQYKFQMINGDTVQFLARVRVNVDIKAVRLNLSCRTLVGQKVALPERLQMKSLKNGKLHCYMKAKTGASLLWFGRLREQHLSQRV